MKKYAIKCTCFYDYEITAENRKEAAEIAHAMFLNEGSRKLYDNMAIVCIDCGPDRYLNEFTRDSVEEFRRIIDEPIYRL